MTNQPARYVTHDGRSTDQPPPPDWWQAGDGRWYPPSMRNPTDDQAAYVTSDGQSSTQPPPAGWWQASDGRWYPPSMASPQPRPDLPPPPDAPEPEGMGSQIIRFGRWVLLAFVVLWIISAIVGTDDGQVSNQRATTNPSTTTTPPPSTAASAGSEYFQPVVEGQGTDGPFWGTSFGVIAPAGSWEQREAAGTVYCVLLTEDDFRIENNRGGLVVDSITFDRANAEIRSDGTCQLRAAVIGDYTNLGDSYTVTDGSLTATFAAEELFSGQDAGPDTVKALQP